MAQTSPADPTSGNVSAPDAVGRGVLGHTPDAPAYLFVLAGHSLGSTPVGGDGEPKWLDLRRLLNLDAVGDPRDSKVPIEATFDGEPPLEALWPEPFCDQVVDRLRELLDRGEMLPEGTGELPEPPPVVAAAPSPFGLQGQDPPEPTAPTPSTFEVAQQAPQQAAHGTDAPLWAAADDRPLPGDGQPLGGSVEGGPGGELTLEDVVYHGGYPGHTKRRKKCVAVLDARGLSVSGPNGPDFSVPWDTVTSVEAQNADEAKFRLGVKVKRNSTVVVVECDQDVSIVLEAQDVPTVPLRNALHELLDGGTVAVA
ncbi:MAG: hypothetical protein ACK5O2_05060 [Microthrixaceae bacterium]